MSLIQGNSYSVRVGLRPEFKVARVSDMPSNYFQDLLDVSIPDISPTTPNPTKENYVVAYNSTLNKFVIIDPDAVLSAAATTTSSQPGLPQPFIDTMGSDLDNQIDLDAGTF